MASSASTPSPPPRAERRLFLYLAGEDHPKACTGRRLLRRGWVRRVGSLAEVPARAILLDPHAPTPLSAGDREDADRGGIAAVDCSWNRLEARGRYPAGFEFGARSGRRRRLPFLLAANPQHYGRLAELTTVEAFAAALAVTGQDVRAGRMLRDFAGGPAFLELNRTRIQRYREAPGPAEVEEVERELFGDDAASPEGETADPPFRDARS